MIEHLFLMSYLKTTYLPHRRSLNKSFQTLVMESETALWETGINILEIIENSGMFYMVII